MNSVYRYFHKLCDNYVVRMSAALITGMILLVLVFLFFITEVQEKEFEDETIREGLAIAGMMAQSVRLPLFAENVDGFILPVAAVLNHEFMLKVSVFNTSGTKLYKKIRIGEGQALVNDETDHIDQVIKGGLDTGAMHWQTENTFIFLAPVYLEKEIVSEEELYFETTDQSSPPHLIGYVSLVMSKKGYEQRVKKVLTRTVFAALFFVGFILFFILFIVRNLSRPLSELLQKVKAQTGISETTHEDLSLLSTTFGVLVRDLERSFAEIQELNATLEHKVANRTRKLVRANEKLSAGKKQLEKTLLELRSTQSQLLQQEKMAAIGRLLAGIAHEMNNSANYISGAVPSLKRYLADLQRQGEEQGQVDEKSKKLRQTIDRLAGNIEEGARRLSGILHDLRVFSYKSQDDIPVEVDIHSILDTSLPLANGGELGGVNVVKQYGKLDRVHCLPGRISQVFINIITNAVQAMDNDGILTIHTWQDDEMTHISFNDTGCGIEADIQSRIFEPFYTTKEIGKGTGLGLGISYSIVRQHGGDINVASTKDGGAFFDISLPRHGKDQGGDFG